MTDNTKTKRKRT